MFKIEKGIEIPKAGRRPKYPWNEMEIGDSFFVEGSAYSKIYPAASYAGSRHKKKFTIRTGNGGVRVWRIK